MHRVSQPKTPDQRVPPRPLVPHQDIFLQSTHPPRLSCPRNSAFEFPQTTLYRLSVSHYYIHHPPFSLPGFTRAKRRKYNNTNLNNPSYAPPRDATANLPALSPPIARFLVNRCLAHQTTHSARQSPAPQTAYPIRSQLRRRCRLPVTDRTGTRQQREKHTRVGRGYSPRKSNLSY